MMAGELVVKEAMDLSLDRLSSNKDTHNSSDKKILQ
jgi:hypothetical protein